MKFAARCTATAAGMVVAWLFVFSGAGCGDDGSPATVAAVQAAEPDAPDEPEVPAEKAPEEDAVPDPHERAAAPQATDDPADDRDDVPKGLRKANPFRTRIDIPEFPKSYDWINTKPLTKRDLKGKFVLFDFWTYCCINCLHILPELKKLEKQFPNELVVIGVHSAKFEEEKITANIRSAVLRYEIEHPVVNDADHVIWETYGISSWPTILLIDPEGKAVWGRSGEFKAPDVAEVLKVAIPYYRERKLLDETPFKLELESEKQAKTPLRFPGKLLADEKSNRLFISDSNHNRIVIATLEGELLDIIGSGAMGKADGDYATATFDHPQGMALDGETLYVADTENHLLRKVDLEAKMVTTIAGTGSQARHPWPGLDELGRDDDVPARFVGRPKSTGINSPWDLWVHDGDLYIAMAGPHQIWKMPLDESEIGPYAGNGREDIVDGPLLPRQPYAQGFSSFAQPSGLSSDGTWLYVADSEGSSIRAVPFDSTKEVVTVVGTSHLPFGRLFEFGDQDGVHDKAKFQHCLGVAHVAGKLYVCDTYNNKIKVIDLKTRRTKTIAGTGKPGSDDAEATFDEPAGISHAGGKLYIADTNNHLIRTLDLATNKVSTLAIEGLKPPAPAAVVKTEKKPAFKGAVQEKVEQATLKPDAGTVSLKVSLALPEGWKINDLAPMSYWLDATAASGPVDRTKLGRRKLDTPAAEFDVAIPVTGEGEDEVTVSLNYYYCQHGDKGVCKTGSVVFTVPVKVAGEGSAEPAVLRHAVGN